MSGTNDGSLSVGRIEFGPRITIHFNRQLLQARETVLACCGLAFLETFSFGPPLPATSDGPCFDLAELHTRNADAVRRLTGA